MEIRKITHEEWEKEAIEKFGKDPLGWKFVCPMCGHIASIQDWKDAGASEGEVAFSCVGRRTKDPAKAFGGGKKKGPCDYAGGGLFRVNPVHVEYDGGVRETFEFAPTKEGVKNV